MNNKIRALDTRRKVAPFLDTPTDLSADAVSEISAKLNEILATTFALYLKTKNFHWHVSGPHFRDYHLLLDEQCEQIFASTDDLAERVRKIGGTTLRSIGQIAKLQGIEDNDEPFVAPQRYAARADGTTTRRSSRPMRECHKLCRRARRRRDRESAGKLHRPGRAAHLVPVRSEPRRVAIKSVIAGHAATKQSRNIRAGLAVAMTKASAV